MKKLEVVNICKYEYTLIDNQKREYILELEFYDIDIMPKVGAYVYISEKLLDKYYIGYSRSYCFGPLGEKYGKVIDDEEDADILILDIDNKKALLQRYYG